MKKKIGIFSIVLLLLVGVAYADDSALYIYRKPGDSVQKYENERLIIGTSVGMKQGFVVIHNKTSSPITVDWNAVSIIDTQGIARRIFMHDTPLIHRANPIPPTVVPPNATIEKGIIPLDYVGYGNYVEPFIQWPVKTGLFEVRGQPETDVRTKAYRTFMNNYQGKGFSFFIPVTFPDGIENYSLQYRFDFTGTLKLMAVEEAEEKGLVVVKSGIVSLSPENMLEELEPGSIAENAGMQVGDKLLEINGKSLESDIVEFIDERLGNGRSVMVLYERDGAQNMITLK